MDNNKDSKHNYIVNREKNYIQENQKYPSHLIFGECGNNNDIFISIVIPTYKRPELLEYAIESAIRQECVEFKYEIIVVDNEPVFDCETDTEKLLKNYQMMNNIKYYKNEKNLGMGGNWNRCFELAQGEWVSILHDDDMLMPQYLKRVSFFLKKRKADCYCTAKNNVYNNYAIDEQEDKREVKNRFKSIMKDKLIKRTNKDVFFSDSNIYGPPTAGTLINRKKFIEFGGFDTDSITTDFYFFIDFSREHKICKTVEELGYYRYFENATYKKEVLKAFIESENKAFENLKNEKWFYRLWERIFYEAYKSDNLLRKIELQKEAERKETRDYLCQAFPDVSLELTTKVKFIRFFRKWYYRLTLFF